MTGIIRRRKRYDADEFHAFAYIDERNPAAAIRFLEQLQATYEKLAAFPLIGPIRLEAHPTVRMFPFRDYVILYQPIEGHEGVELLRLYGPKADWLERAEEDGDL